MIFKRLAILCSILFATLSTGAQQSLTAATKDPQAISILTQSLNAAGGMSAISAIQDFAETGTISHSWAGKSIQGSVVIYGKGQNQFRIDSKTPDGLLTYAVNGLLGQSILPNGDKQNLRFFNPGSGGNQSFPAARIATVLSDPATSLTYDGLVSMSGVQMEKIHVTPPTTTSITTTNGSLSSLGAFDLYLDPATNQAVMLRDTFYPNGNIFRGHQREINFSNYAVVRGVSVPLSISESIEGQQTWSIQLESATFNTGLSTSLFLF
jgi:outer membrane lipoprotein-sorting protein